MDEDLYDEFGNYKGPELAADEDVEEAGANDDEPDWLREYDDNVAAEAEAGASASVHSNALIAHAVGAGAASSSMSTTTIVLHEDKKYYPDADEVYEQGVETLVQDEDTQPLSQPIVAPVKVKSFVVGAGAAAAAGGKAEIPHTKYSADFLTGLMSAPTLIRNVTILGHLHHGKSTLLDTFVEATHEEEWDPSHNVRYTMTRKDEQERGISIKATPLSLVLQDTEKDKSYLLNLVDTPGHVNFSDEVTAALRASDGALVVVDAVEGVMMNTERLVKHALDARVPIILVISKVDRLILELKLPPPDAYHKLAHIIHEVNAIIAAHPISSSSSGSSSASPPLPQPPLNPADGNVAFAGSMHGWCFTLESFAKMYVEKFMPKKKNGNNQSSSSSSSATATTTGIDYKQLAKRLWGDLWYDPSSRMFKNKSSSSGGGSSFSSLPRSFVHFVLDPIYKLYSQVLGEEVGILAETLKELGIRLRKSQLHLDSKPLLKLVFSRFLGAPNGIVDMMVKHIPPPTDATATSVKVDQLYLGDLDAPEAESMRKCDPSGILMVNIVKLLSTPDASSFLAFGRVLSGTLTTGSAVKVLGESYTAEDAEDVALATVSGLSIGQGRHRLQVDRVPAGNWVLIEGVDGVIAKTATLTSTGPEAIDVGIFRPLRFNTISCVNLSVEPLNPSELPKVLAGLRAVYKSYPLARTRVEESGEHILIGTGEVAMDSMMHDLREMYARVEVKVGDPVVSFSETVTEQSTLHCFADTPNKKNRLTMMAEPLDKGLAEDIENGFIDAALLLQSTDKKQKTGQQQFLQSKYGWDVLAARSVWSFGPGERGPNVLLNDTLEADTDKKLLQGIKDSVVQGFQWACREGPLCDEPVRNVKFKLSAASMAEEAMYRGGGQIIPTARRAAYSSLLLATPRLMEPVYEVEILTTADAVKAVYTVLARRRGHVSGDTPKPGTPFYTVRGYIPVIDSFGFETDLRIHTQGLAFGMQVFDHWAIVPGDPLDKSIVLRPLEPSPPLALAREFMVKTRRRKGLSEDVSITKYFDEEMLLYLAQQEELSNNGGGGGGGDGNNNAMVGAGGSGF